MAKKWKKYGLLFIVSVYLLFLVKIMSVALFQTVPNDYLGYTDSKEDVKKVVKFLDLHRNEVSKATGQQKDTIRYDAKMPHELQKRLEEIGNIINLTASFFHGDMNKTLIWFKTKNPLLGDLSPREMICYGRYDKLRKFILNALAGIKP